MLITEFTDQSATNFSLDNAVVFHGQLNPKLFQDNQLRADVRKALITIAKHFEEFIGVQLSVKDITISGSNAAYSYTPYSDLDLHIVVDVPDTEEYAELLDAKKNVYNARHDIKVKGIDVELYAQDADQTHHSLGIYSVLNNSWVDEPKREKVNIDKQDVEQKYSNYKNRIRVVLDQDDIAVAKDMWDDIKRMRKVGLETSGEFSSENLVFKMLRSQGWIEQLNAYIQALQDKELSIEQRLS
jgi:predicted nucleotidyltransferase